MWGSQEELSLLFSGILLGKRIVRIGAGYIQIAASCLVGAVGSAVRIHFIQTRIGQSTRYWIAGHTMWRQMGSLLGHLGTQDYETRI